MSKNLRAKRFDMMKSASVYDRTHSISGETLELDNTLVGGLKKIELSGDGVGTEVNLFNYPQCKGYYSTVNVPADDDGWFSITVDNSSGTGTVYKNFFSPISDALKTSTSYYFFVEVAELSNVLLYPASEDLNWYKGQFKWGYKITKEGNTIFTNTTRDSFDDCTSLCRGFVSIAAGLKGTIKFRMGIYEARQNFFTHYNRSEIPLIMNLQDDGNLFNYFKPSTNNNQADNDGWFTIDASAKTTDQYITCFTGKNTELKANTNYYVYCEVKTISGTGVYVQVVGTLVINLNLVRYLIPVRQLVNGVLH